MKEFDTELVAQRALEKYPGERPRIITDKRSRGRSLGRLTDCLKTVSKLKEFYLPKAVAEADLIVSMPKLKSHHWVGLTASMKNPYGTLPGLVYGCRTQGLGWFQPRYPYLRVPEITERADRRTTVSRREKARDLAIQSPHRPSHIGLSVVKIKSIEANRMDSTELDVLDGTPLLGIKPYVKYFDSRDDAVSGWLDKHFADGAIPDGVIT